MTHIPQSEREFSRSGYPVLAIVAALALVHVLRLALTPELDVRLIAELAFVPAQFTLPYDPEGVWRVAREAVNNGEASVGEIALLVGDGPRWWTPLTYSLLHGGMPHIVMNSVWLLAFGTAVCRRFGGLRFMLFFAFAAIAGALMFYLIHPFGLQPVIGASGAISGAMGAAVRFAFSPGGPLGGGFMPTRDLFVYRRPAPPLRQVLTEPRAMTFLALWFAGNFLFGAVAPIGADDASIAWEAHVGGFLAGFLGFSLFDRVESRNAI